MVSFFDFSDVAFNLALGLGVGQAERVAWEKSDRDSIGKVSYQTFTSSPTFKTIDLYGRTAPDRHARLSAEVEQVVRLNVAKGMALKQGEALAQMNERLGNTVRTSIGSVSPQTERI